MNIVSGVSGGSNLPTFTSGSRDGPGLKPQLLTPQIGNNPTNGGSGFSNQYHRERHAEGIRAIGDRTQIKHGTFI